MLITGIASGIGAAPTARAIRRAVVRDRDELWIGLARMLPLATRIAPALTERIVQRTACRKPRR
ncbi:MAG TPA: hypothetical protein VFF00_06030 [Candidatus Elarobacter sp.]|nr:hypothetical protein [Candidatus Elarobacter sp.]